MGGGASTASTIAESPEQQKEKVETIIKKFYSMDRNQTGEAGTIDQAEFVLFAKVRRSRDSTRNQ